MRLVTPRLLITALAVAMAPSWAGDGVPAVPHAQAWEGLKARLSLGTANPMRSELNMGDSEPQKVNSLSLMGDYYLTRPWLGTTGGLRATSGVVLGSRSSIWSSPSLLDRRVSGAAEPGTEANGTLPYLGVGYTGWSSKGGWGLSADLGLMAAPKATGRLGRTGSANLDDTVRDLRFAPLVQLGLSYSF